MVRVSLVGLALLLVILVVGALVAPRLIDLRPLQKRITTELSQQTGARVSCGVLRLALLPLPSVVLHDVSVSMPGKLDTTIPSVAVFPRLLSLLRGKLQLREVRIESPEITVHRPAPAPAGGTTSLAGFPGAVESAVGNVAGVAHSPAAGATVVVHGGVLTLPGGKRGALQLRGIDAQVRVLPTRLSLDLQCSANIWAHLSLQASIDPANTDLSGQVKIAQLQPQLIPADFLPPGVRLGDSEANLALTFSTRSRLHALHAELAGSIPTLTIVRGHDQVALRAPRLDASADFDGNTLHATLARLQLDDPRMQLSGSLSVAPDIASLEVHGTNVDVDSARQAAATAAGDVPIVRSIFNVLNGGTVTQITVRAEAPSLDGLGGNQALRIQGHLVDGRVHVPGVNLHLQEVTGDATVAAGVLIGEQVSARLAQSRATAGRLRVGLSGSTPELHVKTQVRADAAELRALLRRLVKSAAFENALERVSDVSGTVSGTLAVDGTTSDAVVRADASAFAVSGRVAGLPAPVQIEGGEFVYDTRGIEARDVTLVTGRSKLSGIALQVLPGRTGSLEIAAGRSQIALKEAYPWLRASGWLPESPWNPTALKGTLSLDFLRVAGVPNERNWQFDLRGSAQKLAAKSVQLQSQIATRYPVSLSDLHLRYDTAGGMSFVATVDAPGKLTGSVDLSWNPPRLDIKHLKVRDSQSDASLVLVLAPQDLSLTFKGRLAKATLDELIENHWVGGTVQGDVSVRLGRDQPARGFATGSLEAHDVTLPLRAGRSLTFETLALNGAGDHLSGQAVVNTTDGPRLRVQGRVARSSQGLNADLDVVAGRVDWSAITPWISGGEGGPEPAVAGARAWSVRGKARVAAESFSYGGFTWKPVHAEVAFAPSALTVTVSDATVCGVRTPGTITVAPQGLSLAFRPLAQNQPLPATLSCMGIDGHLATGQYSLRADVAAHGTGVELSHSLAGHVRFHATNGRLYGMGVGARALAILSAATGAVWAIPDITKEGLVYNDVSLKGDVTAGTLSLKEATLNGPALRCAAEGTVDVPARTLDITLLVAPLKTVDAVVSRIPILSGVLGGSLVSVPVRISGDVAHPSVTPLSPSAVGHGLLNVMTRTLKLPLKVIEPVMSEETKP